MAFSFQNCDCSCGSNSQGTAASCDDFAPLVELATSVVCEASNGVALQVVPSVVLPGGIVRVRTADGGNLPEKIDCSLLGPDGTRLQQNVIDTSGNVGIEIDDEFGALQVKGCDDVSCVQRIFYDIDIANSGGLSVDITNANIQIGPSTASFMSHLSDKSLGPNESTTLDQFVELDICSTSEPLCAQVAIETATSNNGLICELTTNCCFTVDAAAPPSQGELIESGQEDTKNTTGTSTGGISPDSSLSFGFQCTFVSDSSGDSSLVGQACDSPNIVIPACSNGVPRMVTFELELSLDVVGEEPITLTSATAVTSTTGLVDVTAQIAGTVVAPGNSVVGVVVTQATIDLCTTPCEYSALFTVSGVRGPSSTSVCTNTATFVFATGATSDKCV